MHFSREIGLLALCALISTIPVASFATGSNDDGTTVTSKVYVDNKLDLKQNKLPYDATPNLIIAPTTDGGNATKRAITTTGGGITGLESANSTGATNIPTAYAVNEAIGEASDTIFRKHAVNAAKLANANAIYWGVGNGVSSSPAKEVQIDSIDPGLFDDGVFIIVTPKETASPDPREYLTLAVNRGTPVNILYNGARVRGEIAAEIWHAGRPSVFVLQGGNWHYVGTLYENFVGADGQNDGQPGLVPAPTTGDFTHNSFLAASGQWANPLGGLSGYTLNGAPLSNAASYFYGESDTAATTAAKEVTIPSISTLSTGQIIAVKPTYTAKMGSDDRWMTLTLTGSNNTSFGAKIIRYKGASLTVQTAPLVWAAGNVSFFVYDGTYWNFAGGAAYSTMTATDITGNTTTGKLVPAQLLNDNYQKKNTTNKYSVNKNGTWLDIADAIEVNNSANAVDYIKLDEDATTGKLTVGIDTTKLADEKTDITNLTNSSTAADKGKLTTAWAVKEAIGDSDVTGHTVNGAPLSNAASYFYGTGAGAAGTAAKTVTISSITAAPTAGMTIVVNPEASATTETNLTLTLNPNNNGAAPIRIKYNGSPTITADDAQKIWRAGVPVVFVYDGTNWVFTAYGADVDTDTTYTADETTLHLNGTQFSANTAAVADDGTALATGDQIYEFVTHQGYITSADIPTVLSAFTDDIDAVNTINSIKLNGGTPLSIDSNKAVDIPLMGPATSSAGGTIGLVPTSSAGDQAKVLTAGRTWAVNSTTTVTNSDDSTGATSAADGSIKVTKDGTITYPVVRGWSTKQNKPNKSGEITAADGKVLTYTSNSLDNNIAARYIQAPIANSDPNDTSTPATISGLASIWVE